MAVVILLYKLRPDVTHERFESWLHARDFPSLRKMAHLKTFTTYRMERRVMSGGARSGDYVGIFDVPDFQRFLAEDLSSDDATGIMTDFRAMVDDAEYLLATAVS
jgi:hypothetical protein